MKTLELKQIESLEGGVNQRNCMILGGFIVGGAIAGLATLGWGWGVASAAAITAAGSGCF